MDDSTNDPYVSSDRLVYVDKHRNVGLEHRMMDQMMRDKLGKNKAWPVCRSWTDFESKSFKFMCMKNAHESEIKEISFDDAPKVLGWKSFKFEDDQMHVVFEPIRFAPNIDPKNPDGPYVVGEDGFRYHEV